jgi:hypothetical protein
LFIYFDIRFDIQVVYMAKIFKGFRFDANLYRDFQAIASAGEYTSTGAFERFMSGCVEGGLLVFPEKSVEGFEVEARVLVDWLGKGKRFYRNESGLEVNIAGQLVGLLVKVRDSGLRGVMEKVLKESVTVQE